MPNPSATQQALPLAGVRVLDLSRVFAGPLSAQILADLGAEVIKVEHPVRGDDTRDWGARIGETESAYFNAMNRNKRSITLDFKQPDAVDLVKKLVQQCDVLVHNFKTGSMEKMGLGYDDLKASKPDLIYCAIAGYDTSGPEAARPGYDLVIQAEAGLMALNGSADSPPLKFGVAVVDMMTGMYAAQAMLAALFERERTGRGRLVEMALYDSGVSVTSYYGLEALVLGKEPVRWGNEHPSIVPYGLYEAADGPLIIAVGNNAQFERFCEQVLQRPDLIADGRFTTNSARLQHREFLAPEVKKLVAQMPRATLLQRLREAGIPCGEVASLREAMTSERTRRSELVQDMPHPVAGSTPVFAPPFRFDGQRLPLRHAPPTLGEATREVLHQLLQLDESQLQALQAKGALVLPQQPPAQV